MNQKQKVAIAIQLAKKKGAGPPQLAPGGGGRFQALSQKLAQQPGVRDPAALAAVIGRRKYGTGPGSPFGK